ncbi:MAG: MBL fold metallo-hydrolase [archaeon]|nr:MBL fold metallo-hydrolase [archaeon]
MNAKVFCAYNEGSVENSSFIGAEGFSIIIDVDNQKTLFDTGMRGRYLIHNLHYLGIKPDDISRVVISHNHNGNIGGLPRILEDRNEPTDVYANSLLAEIKNKKLLQLEKKILLHKMVGTTNLSEHLLAIGPFGPLKEYVVILKTLAGPAVIASCYHCGIERVLLSVKEITSQNPKCLIGGIHVPKANQTTINPIASVLSSFGSPSMYLNHCASPNGVTFLRVHFGLENVKDFYAGSNLNFEV